MFVDRWESDIFESKEIRDKIFDDVKNKLEVIPHPYTGWRSRPNQKLNTISINKNGLRNADIKQDKTIKNCFILGGSVAWGFGASSNEKIPSTLIEKNLKDDYKINVNVINLADQCYSSFEELNSFMFSFGELKPSMVIMLSGVNDVVQEMNNNYRINDVGLINSFLWMNKLGIFKETNFIKLIFKILIRSYKKKQVINSEFFHFNKSSRDKIAHTLYTRKNDIIKTICEQNKIPVYNFLQPDLYFKKKKSNYETRYMNFVDDNHGNFIQDKMKQLENFMLKKEYSTKFFKNISLLNCFDDNEETIFLDRTHVGDKGNEIMSRKISSCIYNNQVKLFNS
jgi:hypothetical protein